MVPALNNCITNQNPSSTIAGSSTICREDPRDQRQHPRVRIEDEVGAHHAGDRAAGADGRQRRVRIDRHLPERRRDAAQQIEQR